MLDNYHENPYLFILTSIFLLLQISCFFKLIFFFLIKRQFFSLNSVLNFSNVFYITIPTLICLFYGEIIVNDTYVPVHIEPLFFSSFAGLLFVALIYLMPMRNFLFKSTDINWLIILFFILALFNSYYLIKIIYSFDFHKAHYYLLNSEASLIRELAYQSFLRLNKPLGYVIGSLQIAIFGYLWVVDDIKRRWLLFIGILPILFFGVFLLERHLLASFLIVLFCCIEKNFKTVKPYLIFFVGLIFLYFLRPFLFVLFSDTNYHTYFEFQFAPDIKGVEFLGEFFNTYSTLLMIYPIEQARFNLNEIFTLLCSQIFIPPGFLTLFSNVTHQTFPLDRIVEIIKHKYGPHPAHSSLADIYLFGWWSLIGLFSYSYFFYRASVKTRQIDGVIYFYLLSVFYLPFRGSLTLNAIRIFWLIAAILLIKCLLNKINITKFCAFLK